MAPREGAEFDGEKPSPFAARPIDFTGHIRRIRRYRRRVVEIHTPRRGNRAAPDDVTPRGNSDIRAGDPEWDRPCSPLQRWTARSGDGRA